MRFSSLSPTLTVSDRRLLFYSPSLYCVYRHNHNITATGTAEG